MTHAHASMGLELRAYRVGHWALGTGHVRRSMNGPLGRGYFQSRVGHTAASDTMTKRGGFVRLAIQHQYVDSSAVSDVFGLLGRTSSLNRSCASPSNQAAGTHQIACRAGQTDRTSYFPNPVALPLQHFGHTSCDVRRPAPNVSVIHWNQAMSVARLSILQEASRPSVRGDDVGPWA